MKQQKQKKNKHCDQIKYIKNHKIKIYFCVAKSEKYRLIYYSCSEMYKHYKYNFTTTKREFFSKNNKRTNSCKKIYIKHKLLASIFRINY